MLSPAFPVGAFAYSHGLEQAIYEGGVKDRASLAEWLAALLEHGSAWNDRMLLAEAWRRTRAGENVGDLAELAEAMAGSKSAIWKRRCKARRWRRRERKIPARHIPSPWRSPPHAMASRSLGLLQRGDVAGA